jgi:putative nucleotidyltransferase with HDIG domain
MRRSSPPRLVTRALIASFATVAVILLAVFALISIDVQQRTRASVATNLDAGQQVAARIEARRRHDLLAMVSTIAENPTLKAALDTWQSERVPGGANEGELVETVQREAEKIARRIDGDVLAFLDLHGKVVASAGRYAGAWTPGTLLKPRGDNDPAEFVAKLPAGVFRVTGVPLQFADAVIGSLELGRAIDGAYARELADLVRGDSAILIDGMTVASTLPAAAAAELARVAPVVGAASSQVTLNGESYALRHMYDTSPARFFTLASIDGPARVATQAALARISWIGAAAIVLAAVGSFWLAYAMTRPIDQLSASVTAMTAARRFDSAVPATGSSRELDALAGTFNNLIRAVAAAEAQTQAAYLGAIRALAAALDARDPYTAGHSERVSALAVAMGKTMALSDLDVDTLRLGALLHDIGKIGVPDEVLGKPSALTAAEFELIRTHPAVGARILRSIPFLAPHLPIVELHHERPDGRGYPYGLKGDAIPLAARIVHVADAYDAMTSARAYRPARSSQEAIAELRRCTGSDFDPPSVDALVTALPTLPAFPPHFGPTPFQFAAAISRYAS